jgi:hypothetical protein
MIVPMALAGKKAVDVMPVNGIIPHPSRAEITFPWAVVLLENGT